MDKTKADYGFGQAAATNLNTAKYKSVVANRQRIVAVEEMAIAGKTNSNIINLELDNADAAIDFDIVFGTPLGIAAEYLSIPANTTIPNIMFTGLGVLSDQQGVGLPFLQELNIRFVRKPIYISHIEVITPTGAVGQSQKSEVVTYFEVPYNSASDSSSASGKYVPVYTEYTAVTILGSGVMVGEFMGFRYKLLALSNVKMNIHIAAIDTPTFQYHGK